MVCFDVDGMVSGSGVGVGGGGGDDNSINVHCNETISESCPRNVCNTMLSIRNTINIDFLVQKK